MKPDDQQPKLKPSSSGVPPRPPINTAVGLDSGGDDSDKHVRVIGADGEQLGIMMLSEAMKVADTERVELVKITQWASAPNVYRMVKSSKHQKPNHTS